MIKPRLRSKLVLGCSTSWAGKGACYVGKGNEKNSGAFGTTICMAGSY